ncbi:ParA family protein [Burkholderia sp. Ac-20345]|uniref:ParA family protein n=1 Tax=Burkholderia sp. Ac-20345 TaxID=2703891 RepID=UPI00197C881D|nr:ParA family protein [Burkholderia sp. Ac-20345]MBN3780502.1 ParA family protein [Burkholderia sp. Ac-20345]
MTTIAVVNQKGGAAKSTLTQQLSHAARQAEIKTLVVDLDKQGSASLGFLPAEGAAAGLQASSLFGTGPLATPEQIAPGFSIIRADKLELAKRVKEGKEATMRAAKNLRQIAQGFDLCVIDTPGSLGEDATTYAALMAADYVICPFQVGLSEVAALHDLWQHIAGIRSSGINPRLQVLGLLPCRINTRSAEERNFLEQLRKKYGKAILPHVLAERAAVKQAVARRAPVWQGNRGDGHKKAGQEWLAACNAILAGVGVVKS